MIIAKITGGLGNQLFQFAMARRLAKHHDTELLLDVTGYTGNGEARPKLLAAFPRRLHLLNFRIQARPATLSEIDALRDSFWRPTARDRLIRVARRWKPNLLWKTSHIIEREYRFNPEAMNYPDNVYLGGFWQSPRYFEDAEGVIRQELRPVDHQAEQTAKNRVDELRNRCGRVISVHVRRGDIAYAHEVLQRPEYTHGAPVSNEYIKRAMGLFKDSDCFLVFSDDIAWCRANIKARNIEFATAGSEIDDFVTMRCCDHHIIANSTFSWWAAWLNERLGRRVIAPRVWSHPSTLWPMHTDDLLPQEWAAL
jgi:Glycosyl transferase family 11